MGVRDWASRVNRSVVETLASGLMPLIALLLIIGWITGGLIAGFEKGWLELLYVVTGAVTFIMVFLIEHATRRDLRAALLKLDVLVQAVEGAEEETVGAERKPVAEQEQLEEELPKGK